MKLSRTTRATDAHHQPAEVQQAAELVRRGIAVDQAWLEYGATDDLPAWILPLPRWIQSDEGAEALVDAHHEDMLGWHRSDDIWYSRYATEILKRAPVGAIMRSPAGRLFIEALEGFISWTLDALDPARRKQQRRRREPGSTDLYEWQAELGSLLAQVAPYVPVEVMRAKLAPILEQPDDTAMRLLRPLTVGLVCAEVLDAPSLQGASLELLDLILDRTLQHADLRKSRYNDDRLSGFDLPYLLRALLFVVVERAPLAARFANGDWRDLGVVMPLVDKMIRRAGWHRHVAREFITLCERAGAAYPADTFGDQILALMEDGQVPVNWKGSSIPASIAGLVQMHADRLHPVPAALSRKLLRVLDALVDIGDRRSAALQLSESFRGVRLLEIV